MQEQTAIPVRHQDEWILVIDSDDEEPERVFKSVKQAMEDLGQDGCEIVEGPGVVRPVLDALRRNDSWGFRLRRGIQ